MPTRAVLTIATTKRVYFRLAVALARSFALWNRNEGIAFHIVTDLDIALPHDLAFVALTRVSPGALGTGFSSKLQLDRIAPASRTLFIDADCLCFGNLANVFERFAGKGIGVVGGAISSGEWFGNVSEICAHFDVAELPKFNGGIYYLEPGPVTSSVYERARALEREYDAIGLRRLRGRPNDELVMAIAMAENHCRALPDDGTILGDLYSCPELVELDVLFGRCRMLNPPLPHKNHRPWYPPGEIRPLIAHFLGDFTESWDYRAEELALYLKSAWQCPSKAAHLIAKVVVLYPGRAIEAAKNKLRPIYHWLFGVRSIRVSKRI